MSVEELTPGHGLQLPHPSNRLEADVLRLRQALLAVDQILTNLQQQLGAINKASLGLGNVNNTSDAEKPVSTQQQQAIDARMPKAGGEFAGGIKFANQVGSNNADLSKHVSLHDSGYGFGVTGYRLNHNVPAGAVHALLVDGADRLTVSGAGAAVTGNLTASGTFTASNNVTAYSDRRLKTDLEPIAGALARLGRLTGYTYTRTDSGQRQTGLIAQEVQAVLPEAVEVAAGGTLAIAYGNLIGLVVEAIKELGAEVRAQSETA